MLEKHALFFTQAVIRLSETKWFCVPLQLPEGEKPIPRAKINQVGLSAIHAARVACIYSDMDEVIPEMDRLKTLFENPNTPLLGLAQAINHLLSRLQDELQAQHFFHLDQRDVPLYLDAKPFGPKVAEKFDKATEDVAEAAKCLALQRPTACVFHLMRVMELGVQTLGKKLKVEIDVGTETWHQILLHVNKKTADLPSKTPSQKTKKSAYAEASAHLQSVRLAWRNEVMHPKQTYTREEALVVFSATKAFMASLAGLV